MPSFSSSNGATLSLNASGNNIWNITNGAFYGDSTIFVEAGDQMCNFVGGRITPYANSTLTIKSSLVCSNSPATNSALSVLLSGSSVGSYSYLAVTGSIFKLPACDLYFSKSTAWSPANTDQVVVVDYQTASNIVGTFTGYTNNSLVEFSDGWTAQICYTGAWNGGFTNDVLLYNWINTNPVTLNIRNQLIPQYDNIFKVKNVFWP